MSQGTYAKILPVEADVSSMPTTYNKEDDISSQL